MVYAYLFDSKYTNPTKTSSCFSTVLARYLVQQWHNAQVQVRNNIEPRTVAGKHSDPIESS